ncbi:hypothetical protein TNCT_701481 [Trichonephila clavata]|uniref:Uncharacterized protein n=1 Tax=Trichonephila clavata TaxID=2740835 RepID=A0A8X6LI97_TRICU|nr:hypothetical protein TNCT_701481 [Trichonephila clavata]
MMDPNKTYVSFQATGENQPAVGSRTSSSEHRSVLRSVDLPFIQSIPSTGRESNHESSDSKKTAVVSTDKCGYDESNLRITSSQGHAPIDELSCSPAYQEGGKVSDDSTLTRETETTDCSDCETNRRLISPNYLQGPSTKNELKEPYFHDRGQKLVNKSEQHVTLFREKLSRRYRRNMIQIRNSKYFKVLSHINHQILSLTALHLGIKYLEECVNSFELVFWVPIVMGSAGVLSFLFRMASVAISRFGTDSRCMIVDFLADTFLTLFATMAAAEMIVLAINETSFSCRAFVYYMIYVNAGILIMLLTALFVYIDVLLDVFDPLSRRFLLNRFIC